MTKNEFEKLKAGDNIYYVVENGDDFFVGDSKVEEKKVIDGYRMLYFCPGKRDKRETLLFLYSYYDENLVERFHNGNLVERFYNGNVFLTKKEAEEMVEKFQENMKTFELTGKLPW